MFAFQSKASVETEAKLAALDRVQAVIEFTLDGTILTANRNFLSALGYELADIVGKHHAIFVEPGHKDSAEYRALWTGIRAGEFRAGQFLRIGKGGKEVWIEASYNPILGRDGKPVKVVKFATDITARKQAEMDQAGQIAAIDKSQAVISFNLDGTILDANANFLSAVGYRLDEVKGQHHRMFVDPATRASSGYADFWARLRRGEYQAAKYKRLGKGGKEIWIEASYNPVLDAKGRPYKVVKFATDITAQERLLSDLREMIDRNFGEIDQAVQRSASQSGEAASRAQATNESVQAMAAASEELAASVGDISQSMAASRNATDEAFDQVNAANGFTSRLSDAATAMGGIVGLINTIAGQINLLALNATIESARAGEAGRGFAVVAQEVKNLANQAAKATDQIGQEINGVQSISGDVVRALDAIRHSVETVRDNVIASAAAVEEQSAVTQNMSATMQDAASSVATISENMTGISAAVTQVNQAVSATRDAAQILVR